MSLDVKLVAYQPYGDRISELPQPLGLDAADPLSDVPSLTVKYSKYMAGASILEQPIEIAREIYNPVTGQWIEPVNSRFILIKTEGDRLDATGTMNYVCPGYSWLLNKVQVYPIAKSIVNGQVQDAEKNEGTKRSSLNAAEEALALELKKDKNVAVEYSDNAPSSQAAIWVKTNTLTDKTQAVPWVYSKTENKWIEVWDGRQIGGQTGQQRATAAYRLYIAHQESQGQLRDTQDRAKLTKRVFTGMHAGAIMAQLIAEARARGNRISGLLTKFTTTKDSAGQAWPKTAAKIEVNTGTSLLRVLQTFVETGQLDFRTNGRELQLFIQDTVMMRDQSTRVHLRYGMQVDEAPDKGTWEHVASEVLFVGDDGLHFSKSNPEAPQPWGAWETSVVQTNVDSEATGSLLSANMLKESAGPRVERTRALMLRDGVSGPMPYVDYLPGDYIMAPNSAGDMESQRVQQITLSKDEQSGNTVGNVVLNDRFLEREIRNQRTTEAMLSGGVVSGGTGTKSPETYVDLRTPEAPRYLQLDAETQAIQGGQYQSILGLGWWWSRKATNGTSMEGAVAHYQVQYRLFQEGTSSFEGNRLAWKSAPNVDSNSLATIIGPLDTYNAVTRSPATYETRVRVYATNGKVSSWSPTARITVPLDDTPPEPPSRPTATADGPLVSVTWDGRNNVGGGPPPDFSHMVVQEAVVPEDTARQILYGLSDIVGDEPTVAQVDATLESLEWKVADAAGDMVTKGSIMVPSRKYDTYYAYRLIATDYTGNQSTPSKPSNLVRPKALVDVNKIQAELDAGRLVMDGVKDQIYKTMKVTRDKLSAEGVMEESVAKAFYGDIASFIKIRTTQLMVSDPVVYTPNFDEEPESWFLFGTGVSFQKGSASGIAEGSSLLSLPDGVLGEAVAPRKRVYPGEKFGYRYKYQRISGANGALSLRVRFYDSEGKHLIASDYVDTLPVDTSTAITTITSEDKLRVPQVPVVPAGAHEIEVVVRYSAGTSASGFLALVGLQVHKQVGATLIENGAITTDKIIANAITADHISANAIEADHISANAITADKIETAELWAKMVTADMFEGKSFNGGTFTGSTIQTSALANRGVKIDAINGIRAWASDGTPTLDFNTDTGHFALTGRIRTGRPGEPGIIVSNASSGWNGVDQGVWFTTDGTAYGWGSSKGSVAGVFTVSDPEENTRFPLHVRGNSGAGVYVWDRVKIARSVDGFGTAQVQFTGTGLITGGGEVQIRPSADLELGVTGTNVIKFTRGIGNGYNLETGASANMRMDDNGFLFKSTSARKYKTNIVEYDPDEEILNTPLLRWQDKRSVEIYERLKDSPHPLNEDDQRDWDMMDLSWHIGSTSEDALAHKADAIVTYAHGEVDGLSYDRFAFLMLPFLRELWADYKARTAN